MNLFYEKYIFFCTNIRKDKNKNSYGTHNTEELRNYMKNRVKELAIKKVRTNSPVGLNRCKLRPIVFPYIEGKWYKISSKEDVDLFNEEPLIKRKTLHKNLVEY